jgi:hypothetical protein
MTDNGLTSSAHQLRLSSPVTPASSSAVRPQAISLMSGSPIVSHGVASERIVQAAAVGPTVGARPDNV